MPLLTKSQLVKYHYDILKIKDAVKLTGHIIIRNNKHHQVVLVPML